MTTSPCPVPCENCASDPADEALAVAGRPARIPQLVSVAAPKQALFVSVSPRFTTVVWSNPGHPPQVRLVRHGAVALAMSQAAAANASAAAVARMIRMAAQQVVERSHLSELRGRAGLVTGLADVARALVTLGASGHTSATAEQIRASTDTLAVTWADSRKAGASLSWVESMMIASAVLSAILGYLSTEEISLERVGEKS